MRRRGISPYQDNEITWLDWERLEQNRDLFRFFQRMIAFRKARRAIARSRFWREDVRWHGTGKDVDMTHESHSLAYYLRGARFGEGDLYAMINAYCKPLRGPSWSSAAASVGRRFGSKKDL